MPIYSQSEGPLSLDESGQVPDSRMTEATDVKGRIDQFQLADEGSGLEGRSWKRQCLKGFVEGNAPFSQADLDNAGRSDMWNVNFRIAEAYLATFLASIYDVFSQTQTYAVVDTEHGKGQEQQDWSATISDEYDRLMKADRYMDYEVQNSQYDMGLYGCGPIYFRSPLDWRARYLPNNQLLVPEFAQSKTENWEECAYRIYESPADLYGHIRNPELAEQAGWKIDNTKRAIMMRHPRYKEGGMYHNWEWHQQRLKNGSFSYAAESGVIHMGHYFWREFPKGTEEEGPISHAIVDLDGTSIDFLYYKTRKYRNWDEVIHPLYFDHGGGGYHHSVIGLGIKMYGAMVHQNRLLNNMGDKAFAPKIMFKPTSATADTELELIRFGDYARIPNGFELQQVNVNGFLEEAMEFNNVLTSLIGSNLAQYRAELQKTKGNPITKGQVDYMAQQESILNQTQLTHYYNQLDWLYQEQFRRAVNFNIPENLGYGKLARKFQQNCVDAGVPKVALKKCVVRASRIVGRGSAYLRKQALMEMMGAIGRLSQEGQERLVRDYIASISGYTLVNRYCPDLGEKNKLPTDHEMHAVLQVGNAKQGIAPVVTDSQNPVVYCQVFISACAQALGGLREAGQQAVIPTISLLDTLGPAIHKQLDRFKDDPTRKAEYDTLLKQFQSVAKATEKLHQQQKSMAKQQQQQAQMMKRAQMISNGSDPETELKKAQVFSDIRLKTLKTRADLQNKEAKSRLNLETKARQARQNMAVKDLTTAQDFKLKRAAALQKKSADN